MMFVNAKHVRPKNLAPGGGYENSGVSGDPSKSTAAIGKALLQIKIGNALAQMKGLMAGTIPTGTEAPAAAGGGGGAWWTRRSGWRRRRRSAAPTQPAGPPRPTFETAPAGTPSQAPDTVFIDELTWEETRDALKAGKTDRDRPDRRHRKERLPHGPRQAQLHRHARRRPDGAAAEERARRADDSIRARGQSRSRRPGAISLPSPAYDMLLDAAARSLKAHGFTDILFIGDSGGNQAGMRNVADKLNEEWKDSGDEGVRAHRLLRRRPRALSRLDGSGLWLR